VFMLLEKRDRPRRGSEASFVRINASNNVYQAWGSFLEDPVYQWARETNAGLLGLNSHVSYVHSKFMLIDPLGADPMVITGSANFSVDSTKENDENMLIVRGDQRVADIYLTEFNRLFNHYYFRSVTEATSRAPRRTGVAGPTRGEPSLFLDETDGWLRKYAPGTLRAKRLRLYVEMAGFTRA
jgi:phosphatidylserine/phosphatidylglycerophosphate/cardiolipin synthase-like enzyme